jgi:galactonate dehydratase
VIKCAPFDEVTHPNPQDISGVVKSGLNRLSAVRESVGADVEILVDCHGRFEESSSKIAASLIQPIGIGWFEEPLDPINYPERLACISNEIAIPLAGGESGYGEEFFDSLA